MPKKGGPAKGSLMARMLKHNNENASVLSDSDFFTKTKLATTPVPSINIALSGEVNGGFCPGPVLICGESRTFKTGLCLLALKSMLDTYDDAIAIFYDCEFGAKSLFESYGIDASRVIHRPFKDVEELKHMVTQDLDEIERGERVFMFVDSIGSAASRKEATDALEDKGTADMTRARALNSFWRIITPVLTLKEVPMFAINHAYQTIEMFPKDVMSGGKKGLLAADTVLFTSRAQIKEGKDLQGWTFKLKAYKSRYIKEGSVVPYEILYDGGFNIYGGLFEIAKFLGWIEMPKNGWYTRKGVENDKNVRKAQCMEAEWWQPILEQAEFHDAVEKMYKLDGGSIISDTEKEITQIIEAEEDNIDDELAAI